MKNLDMQEVGRKIVAKHPYKIVMDSHQDGTPATEQTTFVDVLTFTNHRIGRNFQNIPYSLNREPKYGGVDKYSVSLLNTEGDISEVVEASRYHKYDRPAEFLEEKEAFRFAGDQEEIIVAVILTDKEWNGKVNKYIMLLSEPMTIATMQKKRDETVFGKKKKTEDKRLGQIKTLWGKES